MIFIIILLFCLCLIIEYKLQWNNKNYYSLLITLCIFVLIFFDFKYLIGVWWIKLPICYKALWDFWECNLTWLNKLYYWFGGYILVFILIKVKFYLRLKQKKSL